LALAQMWDLLGVAMAEGFNATQRELEILELRKENDRLKTALGRIQRGSLSVLLDAALSESSINPDVLNEICKDAGAALALPSDQCGGG